jgi:MATE family multidrug resistance protein
MSTPWAQLRPTRAELTEMARLATPLVLVNVGLMLMGVIDTLMLGRVSGAALAAGALGNFAFWFVGTIGFGILMAVDPVVSQALGAGDDVAVARGVQRGLLLAVLVTVVMSLALIPTPWLIGFLKQPDDVAPLAGGYALWSIPGLFPFFAFAVCRSTWQAMHHPRPILVGVVVGNLANILLNWLLIFGHWGFAAGGVTGSAQSTSIARWIMLGAAVLAGWKDLAPKLRPWRPESWELAPLRRMAMLGLPIGFAFFFEFNAFGLVTVMAGWLGTAVMGGHEVALNLASLTFQVPVGAAAASGVMVGRAIGRGDMAAARRDAVAGLCVGVGFMALAAVVFIAVPGLLARAYTTDLEVVAIATAIIPLAGLFQVMDGTQAVCSAVLRGAGDTRVPMLLHLAGFWLVSIPLSYGLGIAAGWGAIGLWWGFVGGLGVVAVLDVLRVRHRLGSEVHRVVIDHAETA